MKNGRSYPTDLSALLCCAVLFWKFVVRAAVVAAKLTVFRDVDADRPTQPKILLVLFPYHTHQLAVTPDFAAHARSARWCCRAKQTVPCGSGLPLHG